MILPFAAGGPLDGIGRILAARLSDVLGQQMVVENVTGAGGTNRLQPRGKGGVRWLPVSTRPRRHAGLQPDVEFMEYSAVGSLRHDPRVLDHLGPLFGFVSDDPPKFGRRAR
jgi:hypothetical protein